MAAGTSPSCTATGRLPTAPEVLSAPPALEGARRREQRTLALNSRVIIEQARGVTAQYGGLHPTAAFERLRHYARSHKVKPAELARRVVNQDLGFAEILRSGQPPHPPQYA